MKNKVKTYLTLFVVISFLGVNYSYACSPPVGPVNYSLSSAEKSRAYIEMGRETAFGKTTTTPQSDISMGMCPNGWRLSYSALPETTEAAKQFNEAVKNCSKLFQLYLASPQKMTFNVNGNAYDDSLVPHCKLSAE